jgi:hypothetical protein
MEEIVIDISENGDVTIEGKGFSGPECEKFIAEVGAVYGETTRSIKKPEYFRPRTTARKTTA